MKMTKKIVAVLFAVLMAMSVLSVSLTASAATKVTKVTLNKTSATMYTTKTLTLKATVKPAKATNKKVKWTTSNKKVATVDSNGKVKALKKGNVTITATAKDGSGKKATCKITVKKLVKITSMSMSGKTINVGSTANLSVTVSPSNASITKYNWSSSDEKIATVDSTGKVKGLKAGTVTITAAAKDGSGKKATCKVTVKKITVSSIKLNKTSATIYPGKSITLSATVSPSNANDKTVKWTSSNTNVATVTSAGVVKGVKSGTATITCTAKDGSGKKATCTITVGTYVKSITLTSDPNSSWYTNKKGKITATISPSNATNKGITWSSNKKYVTVDANGNVTIGKLGLLDSKTVTITAKANDGSGVTATYTVNITSYKKVESIAFPKNVPSVLYVNETASFKATVNPSDASERAVTYKSSNTAVATVDANGNVKAVKPGTVKITATSVEGKSVTTDEITVKAISFSNSEIRSPKAYYTVGEQATFFCMTDPIEAAEKLGIRLESENEKVAVFEPANSPRQVFFTLKFVGVGKTRVRAVTAGGEAKSSWVTVEVRDMRSNKEYFEKVKKGDSYSVSVYLYNGTPLLNEMSDVQPYLVDGNSQYFNVKYNESTKKFDIAVINDIPDSGAYVLFQNAVGSVSHKVWFVNKGYTLPAANLTTAKNLSKKAAKVATADMNKVITYLDTVIDNKKSSTKIKVNGMDLSNFIKWAETILGSSDSNSDEDVDDIMDAMSPDAFIKDLFSEPEVENCKFDSSKLKYPNEITVDAKDVKEVKIINDNSQATYQVKLTLNDQPSAISLDAVASSAYGKTMKVVDRDFMNDYKQQLSTTETGSDGEEITTKLNYGTVTQKYSGGYVIYTVSKVTDEVVGSEYHYKTAMKIEQADFTMSASMKIDKLGTIKMDTQVIGYFTMNVDSVTKYTSMKY